MLAGFVWKEEGITVITRAVISGPEGAPPETFESVHGRLRLMVFRLNKGGRVVHVRGIE